MSRTEFINEDPGEDHPEWKDTLFIELTGSDAFSEGLFF